MFSGSLSSQEGVIYHMENANSSTSVDLLGFTLRTRNTLRRAKIDTLSDLLGVYKSGNLRKVKSLGKVQYREILEILRLVAEEDFADQGQYLYSKNYNMPEEIEAIPLRAMKLNTRLHIVNVASGAHKVGKIHFDDINLTKGYNVVKAYSQSKLANVLFTRYLAKHLADSGITVNCCHPGAVATNMGVDRETGFGKTITRMLKPFFLTPEEGAKTAVFLATNESVKDISGEYFYRCKIAKSSKRSRDMRLAKRLYILSRQLIAENRTCEDLYDHSMGE